MKRRILSSLMALVLVFGLLPATAFAEERTTPAGKTIYVDAVKGDDMQADVGTAADKAYKTLEKAVTAAETGATIVLGEGKYSTYGNTSPKKSLTFVGAESGKTEWYIGSPTPDQQKEGTEYNGDYSFDGCENITFQKIKFNVYPSNYKGFIRINNVVLDECEINGISTYWGDQTTTFRKTVFNCSSDYALWYYTGHEMTFDGCTFNNKGKMVNAYREGTAKTPLVLNFKDCTVNNTAHEKQVLNIKDSNNDYIVNISGNNTVTGVEPNKTTCSRWFQVQSVGEGKSHYATVNIDGKTVWENGKMVSHAIDTAHDKYTDGYKDNAFTVPTYGEWTKNPDGSQSREGTKKCKYCGKVVTFEERKEADPIDWDVSKSKTATQLDTNTWTSDVTLSLPSAEENLASDVVLVMDVSMCATNALPATQKLLEQLNEVQKSTGAAIKTGIVMFKGNAVPFQPLTLMSEEENTRLQTLFNGFVTEGNGDAELVKNAVRNYLKEQTFTTGNGKQYKFMNSGTNIPAGLLLAQEMLENDTTISGGRKYVVLVTDGSTYLFTHDKDYTTAYSRTYGEGNHLGGLYETNWRGTDQIPPQSADTQGWTNWLKVIDLHNRDFMQYDFLVETAGVLPSKYTAIPNGTQNAVVNVDTSLLQVSNTYREMQGKYQVFYCGVKDPVEGCSDGDWMLKALTDAQHYINLEAESTNAFDDITKDIIYAVSAGSTVTDTIGEKFTLNGVDSFTLKVGGTDVTGTVNENTVNFGNPKSDGSYPYTVTYTPATKTFVWTINENVSNFAPVQLTYTVQLTKPETDPGTYGVEDLKGEKTLSDAEAEKALFTNESAVLKAKNSAGVPVEKQEFPKPSVSYTISSGIGGDDGDDDDYFFAIQKVDAQDGHALNGATFELYQYDSKGKTVNRTTAKTSRNGSESGIALFSVDNKNSYDGIWYYAEVTAPEGYVLDSTEHKITAKDFSDSRSTAVKYADTVRNYRGTTPDLLNDSDHFAYVIGYKDGNVRPYGLISRAETTTIFFRLLKDSVRDGNLLTSNTYTDVADDYWANTAISTMTGLGIVQGRSATTFDPKAPITRAQFAAICARFDTGKSSGTQSFTDIKGHWAEKYIERAAELGWIKGFEDGSFRPDTYITRAQAMTMINRVLNRIPEENSDLLAGMNTWPDCNPGDWFYLAVQEATNSHDFKHKAGNYETWTGMNKDPDWTRYEH